MFRFISLFAVLIIYAFSTTTFFELSTASTRTKIIPSWLLDSPDAVLFVAPCYVHLSDLFVRKLPPDHLWEPAIFQRCAT